MNEYSTRQERRETRLNNGRKMLDNRRSVRLLALLSVRPGKIARRKAGHKRRRP